MGDLKTACKHLVRSAVPLSVRKLAARTLQRLTWIDQQRRYSWSVELVRDLAETDVDAFHQFLWTYHLGYAESYEVAGRFGADKVRASRRMFFSDLRDQVAKAGAFSDGGVRSIFEVGCSLGYQLRHIETDIFPGVVELAGIDIDRYAIEAGRKYIGSVGSKVALQCGDTRDLERWLGGKTYDIILCTGVLMYLNEAAAREVVGTMLRHARLLAMSGLAHPRTNNAALNRSDVRASDSTFIHNFDRMVADHGGRVLSSRWEGDRDVEGNTIYFVFATSR
jgi:SAM-dependent methyltransferase